MGLRVVVGLFGLSGLCRVSGVAGGKKRIYSAARLTAPVTCSVGSTTLELGGGDECWWPGLLYTVEVKKESSISMVANSVPGCSAGSHQTEDVIKSSHTAAKGHTCPIIDIPFLALGDSPESGHGKSYSLD